MEKNRVKRGSRFLHSKFVKREDHNSPEEFVITRATWLTVWYTTARAWDAGDHSASFDRARDTFETEAVKEWL